MIYRKFMKVYETFPFDRRNKYCQPSFYAIFVWMILMHSFTISAQDPDFHIYLCFGQSNMAGAGDIEAQDRTGADPRFQFLKPQDCNSSRQYAGNWYTAVPPLWGCSGGIGPADYFGRTMVTKLPSNVRIGVVVVAIPGCKIELFGKTGYQGLDTYKNIPSKYAGSAYAWLLDLAKKAQQEGVIKGILLHQGESNTGDQSWPGKVKSVYDHLMEDLQLNPAATPLLAGELLYQNYGSCCSGHNQVIAKLPSFIPNAHVISATGLPGKDVYHFNSAGVRIFGARYAEKMLSLYPISAAPSVAIITPESNSRYTTLQSININAQATDEDGTILRVDFFDGTEPIGIDQTSPYNILWSSMKAGIHTITAKATDNTGSVTTSLPITIEVFAEQAPYNILPFSIPGRIEAEEFDVGGEGTSFHEIDDAGNQGGATFRKEEVDIENCTDTAGGYNLGWTAAGEWVEYTLQVTEYGVYDVDIRVATNGNGRTLILKEESILLKEVEVPNTGGWQKWTTVSVKGIPLSAGKHVIRMIIGEVDYVNVNYLEFKKSSLTGTLEKENEVFQIKPDAEGVKGLRVIFGDRINEYRKYCIFDAIGNLVETGETNGEMYIGHAMKQGIYFLQLENQHRTVSKKIISY